MFCTICKSRVVLTLLFVCLIVFCSSFIFADITDEYDYTNGIVVKYNISNVDSDADGLYDYVRILTNDSRSIVKLNNDFGPVFYPASFQLNNTLEIALIFNNSILYDKTFIIYFNLSEFDSFVNNLNISYQLLDADSDNYTDVVILDSGISSNVTFYFDTYSLFGIRYVNVTKLQKEININGIYVKDINHFFSTNYTINNSRMFDFEKYIGVYDVDDFLFNYTLYLNVSFYGAKEVFVRIYDDNGVFLYSENLNADGNFIYFVNSSIFVANKINGPYHIYLDNYYYITKAYDYVEFDSNFFSSLNVTWSNNAIIDDKVNAIDTENNKLITSSKGGGDSVLPMNVINISGENSTGISINNENKDYKSGNSFDDSFSKSKLSHFLDFIIYGKNKDVKEVLNNSQKKEISNGITGFSIDTRYTYAGILLAVLLIIFFIIFRVVKKGADL